MWPPQGQSPGVSHEARSRSAFETSFSFLRYRVCVRPGRSGRWSLVRLAVGTDGERGFGLMEVGRNSTGLILLSC